MKRKVIVFRILVFVFCLFAFDLTAKTEGPWQTSARRLNGESSAVHKRMIAILKNTQQLDQKLTLALGTSDHSLALEVISTLELREFTDKLKRWAAKDGDGFSLLTLNSLINSSNKKTILNFQKGLLERAAPLSAAQVKVIVDFLGRAHISIDLKTLKKYFRRYPYLRGTFLTYRKQNVGIFRKGNFDFLNEGCFSCVEN